MRAFIKRILPKSTVNKLKLYLFLYRLANDEKSFLCATGFSQSLNARIPMDSDGEYIPWMNYGIVNFLNKRLSKNMTIFEYGSGYSTLFFSRKVSRVVSVEHNKNWYNKALLLTKPLSNVELSYCELNAGYSDFIKSYPEKYDVIVVDGRDRVKSALLAINSLKDNGVVLLDDSQREKYHEVFDFYKSRGFKELTFLGIKPGGKILAGTTVFYRSLNCLDI